MSGILSVLSNSREITHDVRSGIESWKQKESEKKIKQKHYCDSRHRIKELQPLQPGDPVWVSSERKPATVRAQQPDQPRSYTLEASGSIVRRNRSALLPYFQESHRSQVELQDNPISKPEIAPSRSETVTSQKVTAVCKRSGRVTRPPKRLDLLSVETHLPNKKKARRLTT